MSDAAKDRVVRALRISGRRLAHLGREKWGVVNGSDRRLRPVIRVDGETVMRLVAAGEVVSVGEDVWVLSPDVAPAARTPPVRWVFTATGARRPGERMRGFGFVGLARQAREGGGAISLRHAEAGLKLIADAERAASDTRLTMDWDAGPTTKQRRSASGGGREGDALLAARRLQKLWARIGEDGWRVAWALCVEGETLNAVMERFAISPKAIKAQVAKVLETVARAYES
jgi:Domain of unknown function (DUF6456)